MTTQTTSQKIAARRGIIRAWYHTHVIINPLLAAAAGGW